MVEKCAHNMGSYRAEEINDNGVIKHHYRCNGCNIILSTY